MHTLHHQVRAAIAFCGAALLAGVFALLALVDIYHGEADVRLEWRLVQLAVLVVTAALVIALRTLSRLSAITGRADE